MSFSARFASRLGFTSGLRPHQPQPLSSELRLGGTTPRVPKPASRPAPASELVPSS
jgi:hypothetical protein